MNAVGLRADIRWCLAYGPVDDVKVQVHIEGPIPILIVRIAQPLGVAGKGFESPIPAPARAVFNAGSQSLGHGPDAGWKSVSGVFESRTLNLLTQYGIWVA
jgi:hypothetical protein